jgi:hypothetical protein
MGRPRRKSGPPAFLGDRIRPQSALTSQPLLPIDRTKRSATLSDAAPGFVQCDNRDGLKALREQEPKACDLLEWLAIRRTCAGAES